MKKRFIRNVKVEFDFRYSFFVVEFNREYANDSPIIFPRTYTNITKSSFDRLFRVVEFLRSRKISWWNDRFYMEKLTISK